MVGDFANHLRCGRPPTYGAKIILTDRRFIDVSQQVLSQNLERFWQPREVTEPDRFGTRETVIGDSITADGKFSFKIGWRCHGVALFCAANYPRCSPGAQRSGVQFRDVTLFALGPGSALRFNRES